VIVELTEVAFARSGDKGDTANIGLVTFNDDLYQVYETMLKNPNTYSLGLRGLMQQNLRSQDYHHAYIYAEKLFNDNPRIDKLYDTITNIISKTSNWPSKRRSLQ